MFDMSSGMSNLALLFARVALGVVFIAHGWRKLIQDGMDVTVARFAAALSNITLINGISIETPSSAITVIAYLVTFLELLGGLAIIVGFLIKTVCILLTINLFGAFLLVHMSNGVLLVNAPFEGGGYELVAALGAACILLAAHGPGKISIAGTLIK